MSGLKVRKYLKELKVEITLKKKKIKQGLYFGFLSVFQFLEYLIKMLN